VEVRIGYGEDFAVQVNSVENSLEKFRTGRAGSNSFSRAAIRSSDVIPAGSSFPPLTNTVIEDNVRNWIMVILAGLATVFLTVGVRYVEHVVDSVVA
jgi:hypothetical protein